MLDQWMNERGRGTASYDYKWPFIFAIFPQFQNLITYISFFDSYEYSVNKQVRYYFYHSSSVGKEFDIYEGLGSLSTYIWKWTGWDLILRLPGFWSQQIPLYHLRILEMKIIITITDFFSWSINLFLSCNSWIISLFTICDNQHMVKPKEHSVRMSSFDSSVWFKDLNLVDDSLSSFYWTFQSQ